MYLKKFNTGKKPNSDNEHAKQYDKNQTTMIMLKNLAI